MPETDTVPQPDTGWLGVCLGLAGLIMGFVLSTIFPVIPLWVAVLLYTGGAFLIALTTWRHGMPNKPCWMKCAVVSAILVALLGLEACGIYGQRKSVTQLPVTNSVPQELPTKVAVNLPVKPPLDASASPSTNAPTNNGKIIIGRDNNGVVIGGDNNGNISQGPQPKVISQRLDGINIPQTNTSGIFYETAFYVVVASPTPTMRFHMNMPTSLVDRPQINFTESALGSGPGGFQASGGYSITIHTSEKVQESDFGAISVTPAQ